MWDHAGTSVARQNAFQLIASMVHADTRLSGYFTAPRGGDRFRLALPAPIEDWLPREQEPEPEPVVVPEEPALSAIDQLLLDDSD